MSTGQGGSGRGLLGQWGERLVAEDLRRKKWQLVAKGYRCRFGEIDLIVKNKEYLVFVEVKLRTSHSFAMGRAAVDAKKQEKLRTTAQLYLSQHPTQLQPRFDVAEVLAPQGTETEHPTLTYIENAF